MTKPAIRAVLTGASGALGSAVMLALDRVWECWPLGHRHKPAHARGAAVDLTDKNAAVRIMEAIRPEVVVHMAALADVDQCENDPAAAWRGNVLGTANAARAAAAAGARAFAYISTDHVYDGHGANTKETSNPANVYALTKLWGEDHALSAPGGLALRLNFFSLASTGLVGRILSELREGRRFTVFNDVWFNPLYASFVAPAIQALVESGTTGIYNLGASGDPVSKAEFARRLARQFGYPTDLLKDGSVADAALRARRPQGMIMDVTDTEKALGRRLPSIDEGIVALHAESAVSKEAG